MNIVIAGGRRVGTHLARLLSIERHDVTVIEADPKQAEVVDAALDVQVVRGNAASIVLLQEAGVESADLFVAATGVDETNMIAAAAAKALGAKQVVARVDNSMYVDSQILYESSLGIDFLLCPDALTALEVARYIESPGLVTSESLAQGRVQVRQVRVTGAAQSGKTVRELCPPGSGVLLGVVSRNGDILIPRGDTVVASGDLVTVIGQPERMDQFLRVFQGAEQHFVNVVIMGAGPIGLHLAQVLEHRRLRVKLIEADKVMCDAAAEILQKTQVVCRDATSRVALEQERVNEADVFVATKNDDEDNIMASVLAKEVGVPRAISVVHQPDFAALVGRLGIDHPVTPRACIANRILKLVHQASASSTIVLEEGQVEVLEFAVAPDSPLAGKPLRAIQAKFPREALVATIIRGEQVIVPSGDDEFRAGDSVVVIASPQSLDDLKSLFR